MATNKLRDPQLRQAKAGEKPYKIGDGNGMYLLVTPQGAKYWRLDYRFADKRKTLALSNYPEISLEQARKARDKAREQPRDGNDPAVVRKIDKLTLAQRAQNSFEAVAREWHREFTPTWSKQNAEKNISIMEIDAFPWLGERPLDEITAPELLLILRRVKERGLIDTARCSPACTIGCRRC